MRGLIVAVLLLCSAVAVVHSLRTLVTAQRGMDLDPAARESGASPFADRVGDARLQDNRSGAFPGGGVDSHEKRTTPTVSPLPGTDDAGLNAAKSAEISPFDGAVVEGQELPQTREQLVQTQDQLLQSKEEVAVLRAAYGALLRREQDGSVRALADQTSRSATLKELGEVTSRVAHLSNENARLHVEAEAASRDIEMERRRSAELQDQSTQGDVKSVAIANRMELQARALAEVRRKGVEQNLEITRSRELVTALQQKLKVAEQAAVVHEYVGAVDAKSHLAEASTMLSAPVVERQGGAKLSPCGALQCEQLLSVVTQTALRSRIRDLKQALGDAKAESADARSQMEAAGERSRSRTAVFEKTIAELREQNAKLVREAANVPGLAQSLDEANAGRIAAEEVNTKLMRLQAAELDRRDAIEQQKVQRSEQRAYAALQATRLTERSTRELKTSLLMAHADASPSPSERFSADAHQLKQRDERRSGCGSKMSVFNCWASTRAMVRLPSPDATLLAFVNAVPSTDRILPQPDYSVAERSNVNSETVAHVVLRYRHRVARAHMRAESLQLTLRSMGADVRDGAELGRGRIRDSVAYIYAEDRDLADRIANEIGVSASVQGRRLDAEVFRPGTIEVLLSD